MPQMADEPPQVSDGRNSPPIPRGAPSRGAAHHHGAGHRPQL